MTLVALILVSLAVAAASQPLVESDSQIHHTYNYTQPAYCLLVSCKSYDHWSKQCSLCFSC